MGPNTQPPSTELILGICFGLGFTASKVLAGLGGGSGSGALWMYELWDLGSGPRVHITQGARLECLYRT